MRDERVNVRVNEELLKTESGQGLGFENYQ